MNNLITKNINFNEKSLPIKFNTNNLKKSFQIINDHKYTNYLKLSGALGGGIIYSTGITALPLLVDRGGLISKQGSVSQISTGINIDSLMQAAEKVSLFEQQTAGAMGAANALLLLAFSLYGTKLVWHGLKNVLQEKKANIDTQIAISGLMPLGLGFYNLATGDYIAHCPICANAFTKSAASSSLNYLGFIFPAATSAFLFSTGWLSEKMEEFVEAKAKNSLKQVLENNELRQSYLINNNGAAQETVTANIKINDLIVLRQGEMVPYDSILLTNGAEFSEASITGEAAVVKKVKGCQVISGSVLLSNANVLVQVKKTGLDNTLTQTKELIKRTIDKKSALQTRIDRIMPWLVPAISVPSVSVAGWGMLTRDPLLTMYGLTTLFIATPCAVKLGLPAAKNAAMSGLAFKHGVTLVNPNSLEKLKKIKAIVFDKTGTLTDGTIQVSKETILDKKYSRDELLSILYHAESNSSHQIAGGIIKYILNDKTANIRKLKVSYFQAEQSGLKALINNKKILVGTKNFLEQNGLATESLNLENEDIFMSINSQLSLAISYEETLRKDAQKTIAKLRQKGKEIYLVSGDSEKRVNAAAKKLGVTKVYFRQTPRQKTAIITQLEKTGNPVMMIGDGINDAESLAAATIGVAWQANDISKEAADLVVIDGAKMGTLLDIFKVGEKYSSSLWQNLIIPATVNTALIVGLFSGQLESFLNFISGNLLGGFVMLSALFLHESITLLVPFYNSVKLKMGARTIREKIFRILQ